MLGNVAIIEIKELIGDCMIQIAIKLTLFRCAFAGHYKLAGREEGHGRHGVLPGVGGGRAEVDRDELVVEEAGNLELPIAAGECAVVALVDHHL